MSSHPIVHVELPAENPEAAAKFYEEAFGWKLSHNQEFNYWMFAAEGGPGGGFTSPGPYDGNGSAERYEIGKPMVYLGSEDIEADLARVEACGGRIIMPRMDIGEFGSMAIFADPSGNHLAFFKYATPPAA